VNFLNCYLIHALLVIHFRLRTVELRGRARPCALAKSKRRADSFCDVGGVEDSHRQVVWN